MAKSSKKTAHDNQPQVRNRRARYDFEITDTLECGLKLTGTEIIPPDTSNPSFSK